MVAAVYVVGGSTNDDRNDLRHSLRSLRNAPDVTEVWVVGDVPAWFTGVKMPLVPLLEKFANQRQSLTCLVNYPGAPERFYLFNDDMFVTERVNGPLPTCRNKNRLSGWTDAERVQRKLNSWHRAVISTSEWAATQTGIDPWVYECHTPLLFDTSRLRDAINAYPDQPFAVGELYPLAGAGGEGEHYGNAKCAANDRLEHKLALDMPFLSASPPTWDGALGDHIRALFPHPSKYEEA